MLNKEPDTVHCLTNRIFRIPDSQSLILSAQNDMLGVERRNSAAQIHIRILFTNSKLL